jgi:MYXO-CTERM domain-containing protein
MAAHTEPGETAKRTLHADDLLGICAIYPRGAQTTTSVGDPIRLEPAGSGCGCSSGSGIAGALWPLALVALANRRRSRGRDQATGAA